MSTKTDEELYKEAMDTVTPEALERMDKKMAAMKTHTPEEIAAMAERMAKDKAEAHYLQLAFEADPSVEQTHGWEQLLVGHESDRIEGFTTGYQAAASSLLPHLLDLMGRVRHEEGCEMRSGGGMEAYCTCGLSTRLSQIKSLIEP